MELVVLIVIIIIVLFLVFRKKRPSKSPQPALAALMVPQLPLDKETSLIELEASCRPAASIGGASMPDLVGNMWNVETSFPELDEKGRYRTSWNSDYETPTWNRYSLSRVCGVGKMAKAVFPSKDIQFS